MKISNYKQYRKYSFKKIKDYLNNIGIKINKTQPKFKFIEQHILNKEVRLFKYYSFQNPLFFDFQLFNKNFENQQTLNDFLSENKYKYYFCDFFESKGFYFGLLFFEKIFNKEKPAEKKAKEYYELLDEFFYKNKVLSSLFIINKNDLNKVYLTKPELISKYEYDELFELINKIDFNKQTIANPYFLEKKPFEEIKEDLKQLNISLEVTDLILRIHDKTKEESKYIPYSLNLQEDLEEYNQYVYIENVLDELQNSIEALNIQKNNIQKSILSKLNA